VELLFKLIGSIILTGLYIFVLCWLWSHHIDVKKTIVEPFKKKIENPVDWIATRDCNAIYQDANVVGNITGDVKEVDDKFVFTEICNTSNFNVNIPFEYKREKLKVVKVGSMIGLFSSATNHGTEVKHNVMKNIVCEKIN